MAQTSMSQIFASLVVARAVGFNLRLDLVRLLPSPLLGSCEATMTGGRTFMSSGLKIGGFVSSALRPRSLSSPAFLWLSSPSSMSSPLLRQGFSYAAAPMTATLDVTVLETCQISVGYPGEIPPDLLGLGNLRSSLPVSMDSGELSPGVALRFGQSDQSPVTSLDPSSGDCSSIQISGCCSSTTPSWLADQLTRRLIPSLPSPRKPFRFIPWWRLHLVLLLAGERTTGQYVPVDFMIILARCCTCLGATYSFPVTSLFKLGYVYIRSSVKERFITTTSFECVHKSSAFKAAIDVLLPVMAEELEIDLLAIDSEALFKNLPVLVYDSNRLTYLLKPILTHPRILLDSVSFSFMFILFYVCIAFNRCIMQ
ncbi:unnamed protein product [Arabis nemorensis]|uniref:Uncharacterized protein n=1 Tax=Arabis nemorensis TaxID=586526 RepID=A0A565BPF8_9BRAS|nr:unnamed protein product [Arabis nemorensis]